MPWTSAPPVHQGAAKQLVLMHSQDGLTVTMTALRGASASHFTTGIPAEAGLKISMKEAMMVNRRVGKLLATGMFASVTLGAHAAAVDEASRGELLYTTHCIACHTTHVHWRDQRLAKDWNSLAGQVRRWQGNAGLRWNDEDIAAVTRYLNTLYYHFPAGSEEKIISMRSDAR